MDPTQRLQAMSALGFAILACPYVQPPLSPQQHKARADRMTAHAHLAPQCLTLLLCVHRSFLRADVATSEPSLRSAVVLAFQLEFFATLIGDQAAAHDPDVVRVRTHLAQRSHVLTRAP